MSEMRFFCFGLGFTGLVVARHLRARGWFVGGTCRSKEKAERLQAEGIDAHIFSGDGPILALDGITHLLVSIAPSDEGDLVLRHHWDNLGDNSGALVRVIYLSTTAVYGDRSGEWTDENALVNPRSKRARFRVDAEEMWRAWTGRHTIPLDILRLSGIYGPGRSPLDKLRTGTARRIIKADHVFNRIHVDDIAVITTALLEAGHPGAVYNLADDEPAPPQDVVTYAAKLLGLTPPDEEEFESAELSVMARSFYGESKRICNDRIKKRLGIFLLHPTYREGLAAILEAEKALAETR